MLEARGVSKAFNRIPILDKVDFRLEPGQRLGVAGHNGSGKSTLLSIVAQVLAPDSGDVLYDGEPLSVKRSREAAILGFVPQDNSLLDDLTVKETLVFWRKIYGLPANGVFSPSSPAAMLGLDEIAGKRIALLSGGMQKRVSIAIALQRQPRLLLLDEALSPLDRRYRLALEEYMADFCRQGGSIIYCSHETAELAAFCNRILVLRRGRKAFDGPSGDLPADTGALDALLNP